MGEWASAKSHPWISAISVLKGMLPGTILSALCEKVAIGFYVYASILVLCDFQTRPSFDIPAVYQMASIDLHLCHCGWHKGYCCFIWPSIARSVQYSWTWPPLLPKSKHTSSIQHGEVHITDSRWSQLEQADIIFITWASYGFNRH